MTLEDELRNSEHWEEAYNRIVLKPKCSEQDKNELWRLKEIYRDDIINELISGSYEWSIPRKVEIAKHDSNKKRTVYIHSLKDKYVLGVLYRATSKFYMERMSKSCFSYIKGKNTSSAIDYICKNRTSEHKYGVKVDIHAYFNSVSVERVTEMIDELFYDGLNKTVKNLMLDNKVIWKGKEVEEWKSLIPGCAFGSFFANWCLRECDEYFNNHNIIYARYSDDILILGKDNDELNTGLNVVMSYLEKYGLTMNPDKYTWFGPEDDIDFLGLKLCGNGTIDISDHAKFKIKKQIHRWCRKGRVSIERDHQPFKKVASNIVRRLNRKNFKCYIEHDETFGWCAYAFPKINTEESLREIDEYTKDTIRALKTGKHNKANYRKMTEDEFREIGWVSLVQLYHLYRYDFDYYCEVIELL